MSGKNPTITDALQESIEITASEMDYSGHDAHGLVGEFLWAAKEQSRNLEQTKWVAGVIASQEFAKDPKVQQLCIDAVGRLLDLAVYFLAVIKSALTEIFSRAKKNKTNWFFGLLKLASDIGNHDLQQHAVGHLYRLAIGLAWKKGWKHPEGNNGWKSVANGTLAQELKRHEKLDLAGLLEHMTGNQFAYIWIALERDFIDEMKNLAGQPRQKPMSEQEADNFFERIPASTYNAEEQQQARDLHRMFLAAGRSTDAAKAAILEVVADLRSSITGESVPEIKARIVQEIANRRGVSLQQARKDLRKFQESTDQKIQDIKSALEASAKQAEPITLVPDDSED